jgi:propionyl-CoA synthetase
MAIVVGRVPKTRSGKILRGTMKRIADQDAWTTPATIEDPKGLDEIATALDARARQSDGAAADPVGGRPREAPASG